MQTKIKNVGCWIPLFIVLACGIGCDSKDRDEHRDSSTTPSPTPAPEPLPTDALPKEEGKLNVAAVFPGPGEPRIALVSPISVEFDADLIASTDLDAAITVTSAGTVIPGSVTLDEPDMLVFRPQNMWSPNTVYTISLADELLSADGMPVIEDMTWQFGTIADVHTTPQSVIDECMSDLDVEMLAAVNSARTTARACGPNQRPAVGKLVWNCRLQEAAIAHSQDMATHDFFAHTGSDGSSVAERVTRTGYTWSHVGENLAAGQRTVAAAMEGLLNSPGHCDNIMSGNYTHFGSGYRTNENSYYVRYWTQNFARSFGR